MIRNLLPFCVRSRFSAIRVITLLGCSGLAAFTTSKAAVPTVVPGDTFSIEVVGYNTSEPQDDIYLVDPTLSPVFGTTTRYPKDALGNQRLTVVSSESTDGTTTTDTVSLSVPKNFVPAGTVDNGGEPINAIQFSIGTYLGGTDPLDLTSAASLDNATQAVVFKFNGVLSSGSAPATATFSNGNTSLSAFGQTTTTGDISQDDVKGLSLTITYAAVPEPSTLGAVLLGAGGLIGWTAVRRRRTA